MKIKDILLYPLLSEKSVKLSDTENKVVFIVNRKANKTQIKEAIEKIFDVKVEKVNTLILPDGRKKAYIKLKKDFKAQDILSKLGLM